jgi:hypothetical protein
MTLKQADELATLILGCIQPVRTSDPGERLCEQQIHKTLARKLRRTFNELERKLCNELPHECEGKTQYEIADILGRAIDGVMATEMELIDLEFL